MHLGICTIQRDRAKWLAEWVAFHYVVGFRKFFIYLHKCSDNSSEIVLSLKKIFDIVYLSEPKFLNICEFKVVFHLIYKSYVIKDVPAVLPNSLKQTLSLINKSKGNEMDFSYSRNTNNFATGKF